MLQISQALVAKLKDSGVRIDVPDADTAVFRDVPLKDDLFNKTCTNLLVKRPRAGVPFLIYVDDDLEYTGGDRVLTRAFAGSLRRDGWRALRLGDASHQAFQPAVESALTVLGFDGRQPGADSSARCAKTDGGELLAGFGTDLTQLAKEKRQEPTVGRDEEIAEVVSCVLRWGQRRLPVIVAESGAGKTNLLHAAAAKFLECRPDLKVLSLSLGHVLAGTFFDADRDSVLEKLLREAELSPNTIVAMEHLELTIQRTPHGPALLVQSLDSGARLIGTTLPWHVPALKAPPLARRLHPVELPEPEPADAVAILSLLRDRIAGHHRLEIDDTCVRLCVTLAQPLEDHFPAKAIALLDAAAARVSLSGGSVLGADDVYFAASQCTDPFE